MATSTATKTVHLQILVKKADHLSTEQFHAYWLTAHTKIWLGVPIVRANVVRYAQFHVDAGTTASLSAAGLPMAGFDGGVQIWGRSLEELMAVFQDPEYMAQVVPDEEGFLKRSEAVMMVGWDEDVWSGPVAAAAAAAVGSGGEEERK